MKINENRIWNISHSLTWALIGILLGFSCGLYYGNAMTNRSSYNLKEIKKIKNEEKNKRPLRITILVKGNSPLEREEAFAEKLKEYPGYLWISEYNEKDKDVYFKRVTLIRD
ncbi:MAG: hypothetical protein ACRCX2_19025 [Paraclostridium sp.]